MKLYYFLKLNVSKSHKITIFTKIADTKKYCITNLK